LSLNRILTVDDYNDFLSYIKKLNNSKIYYFLKRVCKTKDEVINLMKIDNSLEFHDFEEALNLNSFLSDSDIKELISIHEKKKN
jgi:hypothetical protein